MSHLKHLNLASNKISTIPAETFYNLTALESLWLNDNQIEHLPAKLLSALTHLREFYAEFNQIERIEANFFQKNLAIERIYLQNNNLIRIRENFESLTALNYVDLRDNSNFCRVCRAMSVEESKRRFDACDRERFESEKATKEEYERCVRWKSRKRMKSRINLRSAL